MMYSIRFDENDSFIFNGETFYFRDKENIMPFIKKELEKELSAIKEDFGCNTVEEYLNFFKPIVTKNKTYSPCYPWNIEEIKTVD